jgi:imidazole glycerol-phosphate synthase subunit HisH
MILTLVDYGAGNLPSVERGLRRLGAETKRATSGAQLAGADAIVLPGVGHFHALARALAQDGLGTALRAEVDRGVPLLGICLGLQAFYERSEEAPNEEGLGWLAGVVKPLPIGVKLPHMGWNQLHRRGQSALLAGIPEDAWFYFAHGFAALDAGEEVAATCNHGVNFVAVIERGRLYGVQFHPEKSGSAGAAVLRNFLELAR